MTGASTLNIGDETNPNVTADVIVSSGGQFDTGTGAITIQNSGDLRVSGGTFNANGLITMGSGTRLSLFSDGSINANAGLDNSAGGTLELFNGTLTVTGGAFAPNAGGPTDDYAIDGLTPADMPHLVIGAGATANIGNDLYVGDVKQGELSITGGGTAVSQTSYIAKGSGSSGTVTVSGVGSSWTSDVIYVGDYGDGTLEIRDGGTILNDRTFIGFRSSPLGSTVIVDGEGSTFTNSGKLAVSYSGDNTMRILNGGSVSNTAGSIAWSSNSTGVVTVDGTDGLGNPSTWTNSETLWVGVGGSATLNILNGGVVSNTSGTVSGVFLIDQSTSVVTVDGTDGLGNPSTWTNSGELRVGYGESTLMIQNGGVVSSIGGTVGFNSPSVSVVTIDGPGSTWTNSTLVLSVGNLGNGTLNILNEGAVISVDSFIGVETASTGAVTVDGTNSTWTNSGDLFIGGDDTSAGGTGTLNAQNNGVVEVGGALKIWPDGTVNLAGGTLNADGAVTMTSDSTLKLISGGALNARAGLDNAAEGTLELFNGTLTVTGGAFVPNAGGAPDDYDVNGLTPADMPHLVIGAGGTANFDGVLRTGTFDQGELTVSGGGVVSSSGGTIGNNSGSTGTVNVNGVNSRWRVTGNLAVGNSGEGSLNILDGGDVSNEVGLVGDNYSASGTVTVNSATWTNTDSLFVGRHGDGELNVQNGGMVSSNDGAIGEFPGFIGGDSNGIATIDGGTWTIAAELRVASGGEGTLIVKDGGTVSNSLSFIAKFEDSIGTATIGGTGNPSTWTTSDSLYVGGSTDTAGGTGSLNVVNNGLAQVDATFKIWTDGAVNLSGGTLTLNGPLEDGGGTFNFTSGVMNVNDATQVLIAGGSNNTVGGLVLGSSFVLGTGQTINLAGNARVDLDGELTVGGGTLTGPSLLVQPGGAVVSTAGSSTITTPVVALAGSSINVTGGDLTIGDATAVNGFYGSGSISVAGGRTLTLEDSNDAVLDSGILVALGEAASHATLAAANGLTLDFGGNITGFGTVSTPNDPTKPLINNGHIAGNSLPDEPITLTGYVKGVGTLDNVIITGTDAPGFSPATVVRGSVQYAGLLEIEVEGDAAGEFDRIEHLLGAGVADLGGTLQVAADPNVDLQIGDSLVFLVANGGVFNSFDTVVLPELAGGRALRLVYGETIVALEAYLAGDYNDDGVVGLADYTVWRDNLGAAEGTLSNDPNSGPIGTSQYATWKANFGATTTPSGSLASSNVPEPSTGVLVMLFALAMACRNRMARH